MYHEPFNYLSVDGTAERTAYRWVWEIGDRCDYIGVHGARRACVVLSVDDTARKATVRITATRDRVYRRGEVIETSTNWLAPRLRAPRVKTES